ncbi:MAG: aminotransferase class IV [Candidatus Omnitrophica bacterium]|nr:aminotransferase class IV [Candidatus Omnitrophota bacterium]
MKEIVFLNGKFLPAKEARLCVLTPGFLQGLGVFETLRWRNNKSVYLNAHLARLEKSALSLEMKLSYGTKQLKETLAEIVSVNGFSDAVLRIALWKTAKEADLLITAKKHIPCPSSKYREGFSVCVSRYRQNENSPLSRIKSTSRFFYELSFSEARNNGFDEAIMLNNRGYIAEATRSNIFIVAKGVIFTPAITCGCLPGITRQAVLDLARIYRIETGEAALTIQDLAEAEEAFLTNSVMGIMPLTSVDNKYIIGKGRCARITQFLISKYNSLLK